MLSDTTLRKAKPDEKMYRLADTHRLVIPINPTGRKLWRYGYRFNGKEKMLALGLISTWLWLKQEHCMTRSVQS